MKKFLLGAFFMLLLLFGIGYAITVYLDDFLHKRIEKAINKKDDSPYRVEIGNVNVGLIPAKVVLSNIRLTTDSVLAAINEVPEADLSVEEISFEGVDILTYVFDKEWKASKVKILNPTVNIFNDADSVQGISRSADTVASTVIAPLTVEELEVENLILKYKYNSKSFLNIEKMDIDVSEIKWRKPPLFRFESTSIVVTVEEMNHQTPSYHQRLDTLRGTMANISFDSTNVDVLNFDQAVLMMMNYELNHQNGTNFYIEEIDYQNNFAQVKNLSFVQELTERDEMQAKELEVYGFDWQELQNEHVKADKIFINHPVITIFKDRNIHDAPPPRKMPHEWKPRLSIDTIQIQQGEITYFERAEGKEAIGQIDFDSLEFMALGFYNHQEAMPASLKASMVFMDTSKIELQMELPLNTPSFEGQVEGSITSIPFKSINPMISPLTRFEARSGMIEKAWFDAKIKDGSSSGNFYITYNNLQVDFLKKNSKRRSKFLTTLISTVVDRNADAKKGSIEYHREKNDSFMRYLWRTVRSGLINVLL